MHSFKNTKNFKTGRPVATLFMYVCSFRTTILKIALSLRAQIQNSKEFLNSMITDWEAAKEYTPKQHI